MTANNFAPARKSLRNPAKKAGYKAGDVMVVFGELFSLGYANGIVAEAEKAGMTVVRSTVGRRDSNNQLRALTAEETASWPKPFINIPLEAGFDMEPASDGSTPCAQLAGVKMADWDKVKLNWDRLRESRENATRRFREQTKSFMRELEAHIPKGANVLFVHTMAGGVPRAKILMPTMNKVFKGTGDRYIASQDFWNSDLGKLCQQNFDDVTANTFQTLLEESADIRKKTQSNGNKVSYVAYGYHGTEVLIRGEYQWQTYTPYVQGWAKIHLENYARDAQKNGIQACVYNCPEILTNSSSIFLGVEVSLYPLMGALRREGTQSPSVQKTLELCKQKLKGSHSIDEILKFTDQYLTSSLIQNYSAFDSWPQHNGKEQMEYMLDASAHLISMHQDEKDLITYLLSTEVFKACGHVMFNDAWNMSEPVWWLGHDVLAKSLAQT